MKVRCFEYWIWRPSARERKWQRKESRL